MCIRDSFKTKREAQAWEREQLNKTSAYLDMTFKSFVDLYTADMKTRLKENTWATRLYNRFLVRSLYSFEKDSGIINGKNSG